MSQALVSARRRLQASSDSPRLDAEYLLAEVLGLAHLSLPLQADRRLSADEQHRFDALLLRREQGEPVAYLEGRKGFWTLELAVNPAVLVPRPETELLVEWALCLFPSGAPRMADLGTGSGAIALALASEWPQSQILATDISTAALEVASGNAERCALRNVHFRLGSWCEPLDGRFDLIVSNPPYIAAGDVHLPALRHEPLLALSDGGDGLQCLRDIIIEAPAHLHRGAWLLLEHGFDQADAVRALLQAAGFVDVQTRRDLAGHERASGGRWPA